MTRRSREPDARALLRFVAEHESLALTQDEYPELGEERIRALLLGLACEGEDATQHAVAARKAPIHAARRASDRLAHRSTRAIVHTDGASRGNPGPAGAGWVICDADGQVLRQGSAFLGQCSNNEAEYEAVIRGINAAMVLGIDEVLLRSDSELLVKQINGEYRVRNDRIAALHARARALMQQLRRIDVRYVPREQNTTADAMANAAIDQGPS